MCLPRHTSDIIIIIRQVKHSALWWHNSCILTPIQQVHSTYLQWSAVACPYHSYRLQSLMKKEGKTRVRMDGSLARLLIKKVAKCIVCVIKTSGHDNLPNHCTIVYFVNIFHLRPCNHRLFPCRVWPCSLVTHQTDNEPLFCLVAGSIMLYPLSKTKVHCVARHKETRAHATMEQPMDTGPNVR